MLLCATVGLYQCEPEKIDENSSKIKLFTLVTRLNIDYLTTIPECTLIDTQLGIAYTSVIVNGRAPQQGNMLEGRSGAVPGWASATKVFTTSTFERP